MQTTVLPLLLTKRVVILAMMKTTMTKMWTAMKKKMATCSDVKGHNWRTALLLPFPKRPDNECFVRVCQPLFIFSIPIINLSKWMNASGTIWDKAGRKKYVVDIFLRFYVSWKYFTVFSEFFLSKKWHFKNHKNHIHLQYVISRNF